MIIKYLSKVSAQRYKNLDLEQGLKLSEGLNIFIGSNGSGKSNFLALLKFLKESVSDNISSEKNSVTNFIKAIADLGDSRMLNASFSPPQNVDIQYSFVSEDLSKNELVFSLLIVCQDKISPQIAEEYLFERSEFDERPFYRKTFDYVDFYEDDHDNDPTEHRVYGGLSFYEFGLSAIPKILETLVNPPKVTSLFSIRRQIINLLSEWRFYSSNNMNLKEIRNAEPEVGSLEKYLDSDCENLALVLDNLILESIDFEDQINVIMRDIVPQTKRIRVIRTGRTRIGIEWHLNNSKRPLYLAEMSDGTVRMLCWAIILNSPNLPSLIVIDEPELGIHVKWLGYLAEWIKNAAAKTQVIICTHSPDLLDKFSDRLENVHVFEASNPEQTLFGVKTLSRERLQSRLDEGWELGDLYRVGEPEVGGWAL
jgi:predicted ATPase